MQVTHAAAVAAVLAGALAFAPLAHAQRPTAENKVKLAGTNGYRITVSGNEIGRDKHGHGDLAEGSDEVAISAGSGRIDSGGRLHAGYDVEGTSGPRDLVGDFGPFGEVDLHLRVKKTVHVDPPRRCHGQGFLERKVGVWTGTVRFEGENNFTTASATRAKGYHEVRRGVFKCRGGKFAGVLLTAGEPGSFAFSASQVQRTGAKPVFEGSQTEPQSGVLISRLATVRGKRSQFTYDQGFTHATVNPPWPFSGAASFDAPDSWSGDLTVEFPGVGTTPLTGPGDQAALSRTSRQAGGLTSVRSSHQS